MSPERRREIAIKGANTPRRRGRRPSSLFDPAVFATLIRTRLAELNISKRRAAALLEISPATLNRISNGGTPDIETYLRVSRWLGESAYQLLPHQSCLHHPDRPVREILDGDPLCQECCDAWVRNEGAHQQYLEREEQGHFE